MLFCSWCIFKAATRGVRKGKSPLPLAEILPPLKFPELLLFDYIWYIFAPLQILDFLPSLVFLYKHCVYFSTCMII